MSNINSVTISGNLTRDPELRHAPSGTAVANIGVAVNRSVKNGDEWEDEASFIDVTVFGRRAELLAEKFEKGSNVVVQGRLEQQRWEDKETGANRSKVVVIAQTIEGQDFFKKSGEGASSPGRAAVTDEAPQLPADDDIPF